MRTFWTRNGAASQAGIRAYYAILQRQKKDGKDPVFRGLRYTFHQTTHLMGQSFEDCIETQDLKSGIRRLYLKLEMMRGFDDLGNKLVSLGILQANLEALRTGKIPKKYRKEALREIEIQAQYLPSKTHETRNNRKTKAIQAKVSRLRKSLGKRTE